MGIGPVCRAREAIMPEFDFIPHANFSIIRITDDYIYIRDDGGCSKSITNDAEWVIEYLTAEYELNNRRVFYADTDGRIDELAHKGGKFTGYKPGHKGVEL